MNPDCKKTIYGQLNTVDRLSDLPDFILHHIISFLGTKQAYRTSILSKRWAHISATNPIIEFRYYCKEENSAARHWPSQEVSVRLLGYMDTRMQRYDKGNLRVRTLRLTFPNSYRVVGSDVKKLPCIVLELPRSKELPSKIDEWLTIAVRNQVAKLDLDAPNIKYQLPDILLSARSLRQLDCINVKIPYYSKAINLESLQTLLLSHVVVEERMLNHIINSCLLLKCLSVAHCSGFKSIVIPCCSQLEKLTLSFTLPENGTIILETPCLIRFQFSGKYIYDRWVVMSKLGLLRNLRTLIIIGSDITDGDLGKLLPELASLETLWLSNCQMLRTIRISSNQLKKIYLNDFYGFLEVTIDAPCLTKFKYKGGLYPNRPFTISSLASCVISVYTRPNCLNTEGFLKLKKLMTGLRSCNALKVSLADFTDESACDAIKFNEELGDDNLGPARDIRELKLKIVYRILSRSSVSSFLNGLFWTCRPDIIYFRFRLKDPDLMILLFMSELEDMANCWKHPLKRIEFPDANCLNMLESDKVDVQLRLHW